MEGRKEKGNNLVFWLKRIICMENEGIFLNMYSSNSNFLSYRWFWKILKISEDILESKGARKCIEECFIVLPNARERERERIWRRFIVFRFLRCTMPSNLMIEIWKRNGSFLLPVSYPIVAENNGRLASSSLSSSSLLIHSRMTHRSYDLFFLLMILSKNFWRNFFTFAFRFFRVERVNFSSFSFISKEFRFLFL